jgi:2-amino-4-hydroxy-6-hydroxymethyldihydropteridine diphosphokinase
VPLVFLGLGSNVGHRLSHLRHAVSLLSAEIEVLRVASVYETAAMYVTDQPAFYNSALVASTDLAPMRLLKRLKSVEAEIGRSQGVRYGPREIDIDLLACGCLSYRFDIDGETRLQVPHPKTGERRFVLAPLYELSPELVLPGLGAVGTLLQMTDGQSDAVQIVANAGLNPPNLR